jgi:cell division protein FtsW
MSEWHLAAASMKPAITLLVTCVAALLSLGLVMLYSSSMVQVGAHYLLMQMVWCAAGLLACVVMAASDYRWLKKYAWVLLGIAFILLALVLIPGIGLKINGARRWFDLKVMRFQPTELAKLALIIALACYVERNQRRMETFKFGLLIPCAIVGPMLGLIIVEPDFGTTMLLASVSLMMLFVAGMKWRFILPPFILGAVGITVAILHNPVRLQRVIAFLNPEEHKTGIGFQAYQAMLALGAGGWTGLGLGSGRQKLGFVPEHHTDFIFSIIGEELGLVATLAVVIAFVSLIICGLFIATRARDTFGQMLATGITFLIGLQAFINIGVVTSALPNKGLPLPFISYGGSNLLMMLACVGLLLSVARQGLETAPLPASALDDNPFTAVPTTR